MPVALSLGCIQLGLAFSAPNHDINLDSKTPTESVDDLPKNVLGTSFKDGRSRRSEHSLTTAGTCKWPKWISKL
jgi:hypothetical protein